MLGLARIAEKGMVSAAIITAALAFLGVISFDVSLMFGLTLTPISITFSCALIAFVVLRHQEQAAVSVMLIAGAIMLAVALLTGAMVWQVLVFIFLCWVGSAIIASVLSRTSLLNLALLTAVPITMFFAVIVWTQRKALVVFWRDAFVHSIGEISEADKAQLGAENVEKMFVTMPAMLAEAAANWPIIVIIAGLLIARYWQACLFNAGGFQREFHALKLGKQAAIVCAVLVAMSSVIPAMLVSDENGIEAAAINVGFPAKMLLILASAMLFVFLLQGLSVLHSLAKQRGMNKGWLIGIYILMPLPPTMLLVGALGIADNFIRIRKV